MPRFSIVTTRGELNKEDPEDRIWHAAIITDNKALCGVKGNWVGVGLVITCVKCKELVNVLTEENDK